MQVLHSKGHVHCNQEALTLVKIPDIITSVSILHNLENDIRPSHKGQKKRKERIHYFSFFCNAFLKEPLTIYSVTVATEPPGPSSTTP